MFALVPMFLMSLELYVCLEFTKAKPYTAEAVRTFADVFLRMSRKYRQTILDVIVFSVSP